MYQDWKGRYILIGNIGTSGLATHDAGATCVAESAERGDDFADFGERADVVQPRPERRRAGPPVEIAEQMRVHLDGRKPVHRRHVVVRIPRRQLLAESKNVGQVTSDE